MVLLIALCLITAAAGFAAGWLLRARRERALREAERLKLRAILASESQRNGQAASAPRKGSRARISSADMSRSDSGFQKQVSGERRASYWLRNGKVDSQASTETH
jgi:hypothetical protein